MKLSQFKFKLPEEKIALHPTRYRDESRLMVLHRKTGEIEHRMFKDILDYFDDDELYRRNRLWRKREAQRGQKAGQLVQLRGGCAVQPRGIYVLLSGVGVMR